MSTDAPPPMLASVVLATWFTSTEPARPTLPCSREAPPLAAAAMMREASAARTVTSCMPSIWPPVMAARVPSWISAYVTAAPRPALPPAYSAPPPLAILDSLTAVTATFCGVLATPVILLPCSSAAVWFLDMATVADTAAATAVLWSLDALTPTLKPTLTCSLSLRALTFTAPASRTSLCTRRAEVSLRISP